MDRGFEVGRDISITATKCFEAVNKKLPIHVEYFFMLFLGCENKSIQAQFSSYCLDFPQRGEWPLPSCRTRICGDLSLQVWSMGHDGRQFEQSSAV